jgi:hypothetical protein
MLNDDKLDVIVGDYIISRIGTYRKRGIEVPIKIEGSVISLYTEGQFAIQLQDGGYARVENPIVTTTIREKSVINL